MEERFFRLLDLYTRNLADGREVEELFSLLDDEQNQVYLREYFLNNPGRQEPIINAAPPDWDQLWDRINDRTKVRTLPWKRWAVAASVVVLLGLASLFLFRKEPVINTSPIAVSDVQAPVSPRPELIVDGDQVIPLDSLANTSIAGLERREDGRLVVAHALQETVVQRTIRNPRGSGIVDLTLSDSTRIWLNAGSSISFPSAFIENDRQVILTGEAYFEVARDAARPFTVTHGNSQTEVLGTGFNISAYPTDASARVTLVHGSVKVNTGTAGKLLAPGQQAVLVGNGITLNPNPDLEKTLAWKNNEFIFENDEISTILSQLEQWYDVDFSAVPDPMLRYTGRLNRSVPLSKVLRLFEKLGDIQFAIHGKNVEVTPTVK